MIPARSTTSKAVTKAFEELILFRWETPLYVLADERKEFDNKIFKEALKPLKEYGTKLIFTPPYHRQAPCRTTKPNFKKINGNVCRK